MNSNTNPAPLMIVDDEPENLNVLGAMLRGAGWAVRVFPQGELALAAAREEPPALVLLDVRMPGMNGYDLCRCFKEDERLCQIPILFISALAASADIAAGFACGGVDYITKPFREIEVLARIHTHLALRAAYVQLAQEHAHLQLLEHQRDRLTHMLVHDMRSTLQVVGGYLEILLINARATLPAEVHDNLQSALQGTCMLGQMVSSVIDVSRMESADIPLHRRAIQVGQIFRGACAQALHPMHAQCITERIAEPCPPLLCDLGLSTRILANLLANALRLSPAGSMIELGAAADPGGVRIWVRDQGPGIPAAYQQRIFEKFAVLEQPVGAHYPSTGLGLAFCKLAVEAQAGTLGVISQPGHGSTFWFTLPEAVAS
jgi:signal transduction histidine kinase